MARVAFRYKGKFVSRARASQLRNLKGAGRYVSRHLIFSAQEKEKRIKRAHARAIERRVIKAAERDAAQRRERIERRRIAREAELRAQKREIRRLREQLRRRTAREAELRAKKRETRQLREQLRREKKLGRPAPGFYRFFDEPFLRLYRYHIFDLGFFREQYKGKDAVKRMTRLEITYQKPRTKTRKAINRIRYHRVNWVVNSQASVKAADWIDKMLPDARRGERVFYVKAEFKTAEGITVSKTIAPRQQK